MKDGVEVDSGCFSKKNSANCGVGSVERLLDGFEDSSYFGAGVFELVCNDDEGVDVKVVFGDEGFGTVKELGVVFEDAEEISKWYSG